MSSEEGEPAPVFEVLFDDDRRAGVALPDAVAAGYGPFALPAVDDGALPYVAVNFVVSQDGRVSFADPGFDSGGQVSLFNAADRYLMGLLRARADAVLMGAGTWRAESSHVWTAEFVAPAHADQWAALRRSVGAPDRLLHVFVTADGLLPLDAAVWEAGVPVVIACTASVFDAVHAAVGDRAEVLPFDGVRVDTAALLHVLRDRYGVRSLLCEGGPHVYASLLADAVPLDAFLTLSPMAMGDAPGRSPRPSLLEGIAFAAADAPRFRLVSVRRAGDHLFVRHRFPA